MQLSYDDIFAHTDIFNPISLQTLHAAGKLARLSLKKRLLELGCGKGTPALFWASTFGAEVEGVDISEVNVDYANSRAKMLGLSGKAKFSCRDLRGFMPNTKYDVVSSLGIESSLYGGRATAFKFFKSILKTGGTIIFSEPVWKTKPVPPEVLKSLRCGNESFLTAAEMDGLFQDSGLKQLGCFVASKEDWELYVRPPIIALQEIIQKKKELASEAEAFLEGFKTEREAAGKHWDDVLWVVKPE